MRLRGDTAFVKTDDAGKYDLRRLVAGRPTVEVTAAGFKPGVLQVDLKAGQDREANFTLDRSDRMLLTTKGMPMT